MGESCKITPTLRNGEESPLWKSLIDYTKGDRSLASEAYNISLTPTFRKLDGVKLDENGEVTMASLIEKLRLDEEVADNNNTKEKYELGAITPDGKLKPYSDAEDISKRVRAFNEKNPDKVATVERGGEGFVVKVDNVGIENAGAKEEMVYQNTLNQKLRGVLRSLGFDVNVIESESFDGRFSGVDAKTNAEGLLTVISIAKGEMGEEAFPEEFAHLWLSGMHANPLVQRLFAALDEVSVKEILGDQYDIYAARYDNNFLKLREEAAGKLLASYIQGNPIELQQKETPKPLLRRIWDWIKRSVLKINDQTANSLLSDVPTIVNRIADDIFDERELANFDKNHVLESEAFYKLDRNIKTLADLAEEAVTTEIKRLTLVQRRNRSKKINKKERLRLNAITERIENKRYYSSITQFLKGGMDELKSIKTELKLYSKIIEEGNLSVGSEQLRLRRMKDIASTLRNLYDFINVYGDFVGQLVNLDKTLGEEVTKSLTNEQITALKDAAKDFNQLITETNGIYESLRFNLVYSFLKEYWGDDKVATMGRNKGDAFVLEDLLQRADSDVSMFDRLVGAMEDADDPLLSLYDRIVKTARMRTDKRLQEMLYRIGKIQEKAEKNKLDTKFMYVLDKDGNPTGDIIDEIDYNRYYEERRQFKRYLKGDVSEENPAVWRRVDGKEERKTSRALDSKGKPLSNSMIYRRLLAWEKERTKEVSYEVLGPDGRKVTHTEKVPKKSLYPSDALDKLTEAQREYYNAMMEIKKELTGLTPKGSMRVHQAVMMRKSGLQSIKPKALWQRIKDLFVKRETELEFGDNDSVDAESGIKKDMDKQEKKRYVTVDAHGNIYDRVPLYYVKRLDNMQDLNTDFSASMLAFAASVINYDEMSNIVDLLELTKQQLMEREVAQRSGSFQLFRRYKAFKEEREEEHTMKASQLRMGELLNQYTLSAVYGKRKNAGSSIKIGSKDIMLTKVGDAVKNYVSVLGMGFNVFSGINNIVMGAQQMFISSTGGRLFSINDLRIANGRYFAGLCGHFGQIGANVKDNKLDMLVREYDCLDDFYDGITRTKTYNNAMYRIIGDGFESASFFMQEIGEHYLHVVPMFAMLHGIAAKDADGKITNLLDSYEVVQDDEKGIPVLRVKPGTMVMKTDETGKPVDADGKRLTKEEIRKGDKVVWEEFDRKKFEKKKQQLKYANHRMHGAYGALDKGMINRSVWGRFVMQFRQWMPASIGRRYGKSHWSASADDWVEGYYRTVFRWIGDIRKQNFKIKTVWNELSEQEKANIKMASVETFLKVVLMILLGRGLFGLGDDDDDKKWIDSLDSWWGRQLKYQLNRLYMETAVMTPGLAFIDEGLKIIRSPAAVVNIASNALIVIDPASWFDYYESGRYEGHSKGYKALMSLIPWYSQIKKAYELTEEDYAFSIFKQGYR